MIFCIHWYFAFDVKWTVEDKKVRLFIQCRKEREREREEKRKSWMFEQILLEVIRKVNRRKANRIDRQIKKRKENDQTNWNIVIFE